MTGKRDGRLDLSTRRDDRWFAQRVSQIAWQIRHQSTICDATVWPRASCRPKQNGTIGSAATLIEDKPKISGFSANRPPSYSGFPISIRSRQVPVVFRLIHGDIFEGAFDDRTIEHIPVVVVHTRYVNGETHTSATPRRALGRGGGLLPELGISGRALLARDATS